MPVTHIGSFRGVMRVFRWEPGDADELLEFSQADAMVYTRRDLAVSHETDPPRLTWQLYSYETTGNGWMDPGPPVTTYSPTGVYEHIELAPGLLLQAYPGGPPEVVDPAGYWESDQYGRPARLDDLLADQ